MDGVAMPMGFSRSSGVTLSWCDICVWVWKKRPHTNGGLFRRAKYDHVQILNNVSGVVKSGTLMAIMGASGAGKTTLLATVSQRIKGNAQGDILVNGKPVDRNFMNHISGFVPQQDLAVDSLTVGEHMEFMACLKMDSRVRTAQRHRRITSLISELALVKCRHTRLSALSGGERKRLSLAVQLLTDPLLLFCDEPTSGLDSYSAGVVIEKLRQLAERGKAIVCTIHQPASGLFDMFNQVLLLAGGRVAFHGEVGAAALHFNSLGLKCPTTFNKAEFYVSQLALIPGKEAECHKKIQWLCDEFDNSSYGRDLCDQIIAGCKSKTFFKHQSSIDSSWSSELGIEVEKEDYFQNYLSVQKPRHSTQLYWLAWRSVIDMFRNATDNLLRGCLYLMIALLLATPYINIEIDQPGIQNMQGLLYLIITETIFTFSYSMFHTFPAEIPVLLREISNGLYKPGPYYLSKMLIMLPRTIVEPFLYTTLVFWIVGLKGGFQGFLLFCIPVVFSATAATAYGCVMSAAFESVSTASLVSVPIDFVSLTFSGIYLHLGNLPMHLSWMRYISQFYYGTEAVSILQWENINRIPCYDNPNLPCIKSGMGVLEKYGYDPENFNFDLLGLSTIYVVCHLVGFVALWIRSKQQPVY